MPNVFIVHGIEGSPEENWFQWLKKELESLGCTVFVPRFPNPGNPALTAWLQFFDQFKEHLSKDSIVVGHSMGAAFLLRVLEEHSVKAAFFVAGFTGKVGNEFEDRMKTFSQRTFDWSKIRENCRKFYVFHSDNDPYVKLEKGKEIARNLGTEVILVEKAGHFNTAAGYGKFGLLLEKIRAELVPQKN